MEYVSLVLKFIEDHAFAILFVCLVLWLISYAVKVSVDSQVSLGNLATTPREQDMEKFVAFGGGQHIGEPTTLEKCYEWANNALATKTGGDHKIYICEIKEVVTYAAPPISRTAFVPANYLHCS